MENTPSLDAVCPGVKIALRDDEAAIFDSAVTNDALVQPLSVTVSPVSNGIKYIDSVLSMSECHQLCMVSKNIYIAFLNDYTSSSWMTARV